jgi:sec-independent protein translocase protein TatB
MFDVGGGELILIVMAFLILFGPKKIPEMAKNAAKVFYKIKQAQNDIKSQFDSVTNEVRNPANEIKSSIDNSIKDNLKINNDEKS